MSREGLDTARTSSSSSERRNLAKDLIREGLALYREQRLNAALESWRTANQYDPFNMEVLFYIRRGVVERDKKRLLAALIGQSYTAFNTGDYERTLINALMIRGLEPTNKQAYKYAQMSKDAMGNVLKDLGFYNGLERDFKPEEEMKKRSTQRKPSVKLDEDDEISIDNALDVAKQGEYEKARAILERCAARPTIPEHVIAKAHASIDEQEKQAAKNSFSNLEVYAIPTGLQPEQVDADGWEIEDLYLYDLSDGTRKIGTLLKLSHREPDENLATLHRMYKLGIIQLSAEKKKASK